MMNMLKEYEMRKLNFSKSESKTFTKGEYFPKGTLNSLEDQHSNLAKKTKFFVMVATSLDTSRVFV